MARKLTLLVALLLVLPAGATGAAVAQENNSTANATSTATPTPEAQDSGGPVQFAGDPSLTIQSWDYTGSTFRITFRANVPKPVTLTAINEDDAETGSGTIRRVNLVPGENVVTIDAPSGVVYMTTETSIRNQRYHYLKADPGTEIIGGPWSGRDAQLSALGAGVGTALTALAIVLVKQSGIAVRPRREA